MLVKLEPLHVILGIAFLFGLIGFFRGASREFWATVVIILVQALIRWQGKTLVKLTNNLYLMVRIAVEGRFDLQKIKEALDKVGEIPPLIPEEQEMVFLIGVFFLTTFLVYVLSNRFIKVRPVTWGPLIIHPGWPLIIKLAGAALGAINGYLIAYFLVPQVFPEPETTVVLPSGPMTEFLGKNLFNVVIGIIAIIVFLGLRASSKGKG
jgi:hypothetical protein